jgi:hypothetical protein
MERNSFSLMKAVRAAGNDVGDSLKKPLALDSVTS